MNDLFFKRQYWVRWLFLSLNPAEYEGVVEYRIASSQFLVMSVGLDGAERNNPEIVDSETSYDSDYILEIL